MNHFHYRKCTLLDRIVDGLDRLLYWILYPYYWIADIPIKVAIDSLEQDIETVKDYDDKYRVKYHVFNKNTVTVSELSRYVFNQTTDLYPYYLISKWATNSQGVYLPNRTIKHVLLLMNSRLSELKNKLKT